MRERIAYHPSTQRVSHSSTDITTKQQNHCTCSYGQHFSAKCFDLPLHSGAAVLTAAAAAAFDAAVRLAFAADFEGAFGGGAVGAPINGSVVRVVVSATGAGVAPVPLATSNTRHPRRPLFFLRLDVGGGGGTSGAPIELGFLDITIGGPRLASSLLEALSIIILKTARLLLYVHE